MTGFPGAIVFYALAALCLGGAVVVVFRRDAVSGAMGLLAVLMGTAGLFALLSAHFLAVAQVLVYAGAVMVLIVFAIFLLDAARLRPIEFKGILMKVLGVMAACLSLLLLVSVAFDAGTGLGAVAAKGPAFGTMESVGRLLFGPYLLHFELISAVLLVAMMGAVVLARRRDG
jgi:NADH-quinone oxidoreductase subunit J